MEEILEQIKSMGYAELGILQDEISKRIAKLDKYDDMRQAELEDWGRDNNDEY